MGTGHPDDDDELHVAIEGPAECVDKALREVELILFNPEEANRLKQEQLKNLAEMNGNNNPATHGLNSFLSQYGQSVSADDENSVELRVPNNLVGLIIGKGGDHIQKLQMQTGCHVQIAKESDMKPGETLRSIVLKGSAEAVREAKKRVDDLILERTTPQHAQNKQLLQKNRELDHSFIIKLPVPNDKVGIVIGRGGVTIKGIQERTQAQVQIPQGPDEDNPAIRTLSVGADTREAAEAAQMEIFLVLQQHQMQASMPPPNSVFIAVPDDKVGIIIGKQGSTIKDIQMRTQTRIQIPTHADPGSNPPVRTCSIQGSPEAQFIAKFEIETLLGLMPGSDGGGRMPNPPSYGGMGWGGMPAYGAMPQMYMAPPQMAYGGMMAGYASQPAVDPYYGYHQQQQQQQQQ
eukprot:gene3002-3681_t